MVAPNIEVDFHLFSRLFDEGDLYSVHSLIGAVGQYLDKNYITQIFSIMCNKLCMIDIYVPVWGEVSIRSDPLVC